MTNYTDILTANLANLRQILTGLSVDDFVVHTLEGLMQIERKEYLLKGRSAKLYFVISTGSPRSGRSREIPFAKE